MCEGTGGRRSVLLSVATVSYLLPGSELLPPLLQLQAVFLIQLLQFLGLVFNQQVAFLILTHTKIQLLRVSCTPVTVVLKHVYL